MAKEMHVGVSGVDRLVKQPAVGVSAVTRNVKEGYVGVSGVSRQFFASGEPISNFSVGDSVYLMENGVAVEYLVVHQGNPDATVYGTSCDGTWLLRKDIYSTSKWGVSSDSYPISTLNSYLNNTFYPILDSYVQSAIKPCTINYYKDNEYKVSSANVFALAGSELGWTTDNSAGFYETGTEGACLDYFKNCKETDSKRIAYLNGTATEWWTRTFTMTNVQCPFCVTEIGAWRTGAAYYETLGVRPALILDSATLVNPETLIVTE